jgi:hypothetical protein
MGQHGKAEQHQEYKKQDLGNARRRAGDTTETE